MWVGDQRHAPAALPRGNRLDTLCIEGSVGPRAGQDRCRKSRPPPGFDPRTFQPVASRYTDYAIPVPISEVLFLKISWIILCNLS